MTDRDKPISIQYEDDAPGPTASAHVRTDRPLANAEVKIEQLSPIEQARFWAGEGAKKESFAPTSTLYNHGRR